MQRDSRERAPGERESGERLTGLLSAAPVLARGMLTDGQTWVLRWDTTTARAGALAVDSAVGGHALARLPGPEDDEDRGLTARWMSTSATARTGTVAVVTGRRIATVTMTAPQVPPSVGELLFRDPDTGQGVFVVRGVIDVGEGRVEGHVGGGRVEGRDENAVLVAADELGGLVAVDAAAARRPAPEVPAVLGVGFVAAALVLVAVAVLVTVVVGPSVVARAAVLVLGFGAIALPAIRLALARRRDDPAPSRRPPHDLAALALQVGTSTGCLLWAADPASPRSAAITGVVTAVVITFFAVREERRNVLPQGSRTAPQRERHRPRKSP